MTQVGLKYFVVLGPQECAKRVPMSLAKFFHPFEIVSWVLLFLAVVYLHAAVGCMQPSASFHDKAIWLVASLFEQGDDATTLRRSSVLMIVWAYAALHLRNFYTFSMYTDLTATADPMNLPKAMEDLTQPRTNITIYCSHYAEQKIYWDLESMRKHSGGKKYIAEFFLRLNDSIINIGHLEPGYLSNKMMDVLMNAPDLDCGPELPDQSGRRSPSRKCGTKRRYALIYTSGDLRFLLGIFANRPILTLSGEHEILPVLRGWGCFFKFFFADELYRGIASLTESGMQDFFSKWIDLRTAVQQIRLAASLSDTRNYLNLIRPFALAEWFLQKVSKSALIKDIQLGDAGDEVNDPAGFAEFALIFNVYGALCAGCWLPLMLELVSGRPGKNN